MALRHHALMSIFDIHEAEIHLSSLVDEAIQGGEVVIARSNHPLVKLVPIEESRPARRLGTAADQVRISPDFDEPLEDFDQYR